MNLQSHVITIYGDMDIYLSPQLLQSDAKALKFVHMHDVYNPDQTAKL